MNTRSGGGIWEDSHLFAFSTQTILGSSTCMLISNPRSKPILDRKSTRLNSSHANISYAVFCLKKKKKNNPA